MIPFRFAHSKIEIRSSLLTNSRDPEPQVTTPVSTAKPWHTQIHRDAFSYGAVGNTVDTRTIVDFRFFGIATPNENNTITFETKYTDAFGMPQPTFHFKLSDEDAKQTHEMMTEYVSLAMISVIAVTG